MSNIKIKVATGVGALAFSLLATSVAAATSPVEVTSSDDRINTSQSASFNDSAVADLSRSAAYGRGGNISGKDLIEEKLAKRYIVSFKETKDEAVATDRFSRGGTPAIKAVENGQFNVANAQNILKAAGAQPVRSLENHKMMVAMLSKTALAQLADNPNIDTISIDAKRSLMAQSTPYGITMVQGTQLNQNDTSRRRVCVIDTGYNYGHPDLPEINDGLSGVANNSSVGNWYNDGNGHGTHVAGTIGAISNNEGVVGVYPGVNMHIVKIFNDSGQWTFASDLITAIDQCKDAGSNVVNMSLGGGSSSSAERNAMQSFVDDGIMLVAAAGNAGNSTKSYPASYPAVISVAAVDSSENRASYSQYNDQVEIAGPGTSVTSTWPTNTYNSISGTSMATPHVAGAAALVWSFFPQCSNQQIRNALNVTAKDKGAAGRDNFYGNGIVKARDAYDYIATNGCDGSGGSDGGGGGVEPVSGQLNNLSDSRNNWKRYTWNVPAGVSTLTISISGGSGDADLYIKRGSQPETNSYDCRPYRNGNNETCTFNNPQAGTYHIGIRAYSNYSNVTMRYSYE
uniref:S8 family serine peptidase n=1 Tax=Ningiella ruwaisensis TaxID=2364274 RepID=UPI0010A0C1AF|nr:S8 family serine peptidase [Ningiella ruwaisensis]